MEAGLAQTQLEALINLERWCEHGGKNIYYIYILFTTGCGFGTNIHRIVCKQEKQIMPYI